MSSPASQHRAVLGAVEAYPAGLARPVAGPIAILPEHRDDLADAVRAGGGDVAPLSEDTRGVIWLSAARSAELAELLDSHPGIGWVQLPSAGIDGYAAALAGRASDRLPLWTSAKGAFSQPVAEHALMLSLALFRNLPRRARARSWANERDGRSLFGVDVLIVGAGGIAAELLTLLAPFGARVTVVRRGDRAMPGAAMTVPSGRLMEVLRTADLVILAAASTEETRHLIGEPELAAMKPDAYLVNIARGALIDTDALVAALAAGGIAGAGLDVTAPEPLPDGHPLWSEPRCVITPHAADNDLMMAPLMAERVRANVAAFVTGGDFVGIADPTLGY